MSFISQYDPDRSMNQKQLAFMVKYPQFAMKLVFRVLKELHQQYPCNFFQMVIKEEEEMIKMTEKKQNIRIEDILIQCDENMLITMKTLIAIHKQLHNISKSDIRNLNLLSPNHHPAYSDLSLEIYFPAVLKVYFAEF